MPKYTVVARTRASAVFYPGKALGVPCTTPIGPVALEFRTSYQAGFDAPLPVDFYVQAVGEANNSLEAEAHFVNAAEEVTNVIAFVTNAHLGHLELELVFGCSPEATEHDFMQRFAPLPPVIHVPARPIDPDHLVAFIDLLQLHAERERIQRAIAQYVEALRRWNSGHEIMCVAHLYMGIEALTKSLLRSEKSKLGVDDLGLAAAWNIKITKSDTSKLDLNKLDGEVRRRLIFQGDDECFSKVKSVSDGFEHGFAGYATMQQPARETVSKAATYLRTAIVKILAPSGKMDLILTDRNWAEPRGPIALSKKIRGKLKGNVDALAIMGNPYPQLVWRSSLKTVRIEADGRYGYAPQEQFDPQLGEGTELQLGSIEVWDDTVMTSNVSAASKAIAPTPMEVVITRKQQKWRKKIGNFIRGLGHLIQELFAD